MRVVLSVALAVGLVILSGLTQHQFAQAQFDAQFGRNLILNGGAEAGPGAPDDEAIIPPPLLTAGSEIDAGAVPHETKRVVVTVITKRVSCSYNH